MEEARKGRQTPTQSVVLPYSETLGQDAVSEYEQAKRKALEWQVIQMCDLMAVNDEGLWVHTKYGLAVPRRNGKNETINMRELWGLLHGEAILHTAHRTTTSHAAWERMCKLLDDLGYVETARLKKGSHKSKKRYKSFKQYGLESIEIDGQPGRINFRTRSSKGGLGEGYDLLVIDEAQEYETDQESALKYVVSDSANPQTIFIGTPPTAVSAGTVFVKLRESALAGETINTGWAEWSLPGMTEDVNARENWYETNPSLGTILTERKILDEIGPDKIDFNIQRLGVWLTYNLHSEISEAEWEEHRIDVLPKLKGPLFAGIKYGRDGANVALSIAAKTTDGNIFVEAVDCQSIRNGTGWILRFLEQAELQAVAIDGADGQTLLADQIKGERIKVKVILPTVKEVIEANAIFRDTMNAGTLLHMGQSSLTQAATNCEKRAIGTGGGYGYKSLLEDVDISLLDSVILADWLCSTARERRKQTVSY